MSIFQLTVFLNLCWLGYLTFLVYRKNQVKIDKKPIPPSSSSFSRDIKINLTRFNPFNSVGGDQSFILILLDNLNDGVIITSLHNRDSTRVYAKPIKNGKTDKIALSKEEQSALVKAVSFTRQN